MHLALIKCYKAFIQHLLLERVKRPLYIDEMAFCFLCLCTLFVLLVTTLVLRRLKPSCNEPPSVPGLPWIGNILQMNSSGIHLDLTNWARQCGPVGEEASLHLNGLMSPGGNCWNYYFDTISFNQITWMRFQSIQLPGGRFIVKMPYQHRDSHCKDKDCLTTVLPGRVCILGSMVSQ